MSTFFELRGAKQDELRFGPSVPDELAAGYPLLADVLRGRPDGRGGWEVPPMSIIIWAEEGTLRAMLNAREGLGEAWFFKAGVDPADPFGSLEGMLASGGLDPKRAKKGGPKY
jgi:hypothetical protein